MSASGARRARRHAPTTIEGTAQRDEPNAADDSAPLPDWATDPNIELPLGYELRGSTHCLTLGRYNEPRPVVKSALSPLELPATSLLALAGGAWEAATHRKCSLDMAQTIARGWLACYRQAMQ